ncbi:precorrin-6Y C5,15-methyltransferase (decarboxylating) [Desulfosalsimonas propionicica]|uniref:Precorrin-6Y C5,15-methyltransferase (Decarboxylating) n=1 Tax=Desulfosalsimonas propionicica TaxID=332175 RepID=A0A7W0HKT2_9BACT|nr:precorrin-6y C5,15-methyltransferase (decarboxylating) subunit CbiE [Desulfosalsimonas propionicica]MBA2881555.1 precorrin-6Y C5,15-methyltransferase (decarboxylating) [Desulfosalsimonas propionicica]
MKNRIHTVGMGMGRADLSQRHMEVIENADFLVGTERHLNWFAHHRAKKRKIDSPMSGVLADIETFVQSGTVAVLASGDPLFYGIGTTLIRHFGGDAVTVYPNISSMAAAFGRINRSWQEAAAVSMHARDGRRVLLQALAAAKPVFVLTDPENSPDRVAQMVLQDFSGDVDIWVAERMGHQDECIHNPDISQAAGQTWRTPNCVILVPKPASRPGPALFPGLPEDSYAHKQGMITKAEIRAVVFSKLCPQPGDVFWDLGAASGSVAIEAAFFMSVGRIFAVEKNPERAANIRTNAEKFAPNRVAVVEDDISEAIKNLPDPDRIFVGGGGKDLEAILLEACPRLASKGRIVINVVVLENLGTCLAVLKNLGLAAEVVQVQISRSSQMAAGMRMAAHNPVFVVTGEKP